VTGTSPEAVERAAEAIAEMFPGLGLPTSRKAATAALSAAERFIVADAVKSAATEQFEAVIAEVADEIMKSRLHEVEAAVRASERAQIIAKARELGATYPVTLDPPAGSERAATRTAFPFADYLEDA
jgi:hypothetical protein